MQNLDRDIEIGGWKREEGSDRWKRQGEKRNKGGIDRMERGLFGEISCRM